MKAIVTGAAGFIGSHLSEHLVNAGHTVTGIDVFTDYYPRERKEHNLARLRASNRFTFVETALADADWARLLDDATWVFHLAAQAGVRKSWGRDFHVYTVNNVEGTQILLEACKGRPIERLVYASSSSVYGDDVPLPMVEDARPQPVSPYGVTKLSAEQLCNLYYVNYRVPAVSLPAFPVYRRPRLGLAPGATPEQGWRAKFQWITKAGPFNNECLTPAVPAPLGAFWAASPSRPGLRHAAATRRQPCRGATLRPTSSCSSAPTT